MKKFYSLVLMCMLVLTAGAQGSVEIDGINYKLGADMNAQVTGGVKGITSVVIPATITSDGKTYNVTSIAEQAFGANASITSVQIGANVESLGVGAFEECKKLTSVSFDDGSKLTVISSSAFSTCPKLSKVTFAKNGALATIANSAFTACPMIDELVFPATLNNIGYYAFGECEGLRKISFEADAKLTEIEPFAFNTCTSLYEITLPASLKVLADMAFTSCGSLKTINAEMTEPFAIGEVFDYKSSQTLYVPEGCKAKYEAKNGWKRFKNIVENGASAIESVVAEAQNDVIYDLQGRRVQNPSNGIFIKNGKKVVM